MRKIFFIVGVLAFMLILTGCNTQNNQQNPEERKYFQGYDGVQMEFADGDSPPPRIYYYSDTEDNSFDISVQVSNEGSSFSRGGLYLSGYDPNLIHVRGINPDMSGVGACGFSLGNIGFGEYGFQVKCDKGSLSVGEGGQFSLEARDFGQMLGEILGETGWNEVPLLGGADFSVDVTDENTKAQVSLSPGANINFEYGSRGRLMIALFAGIDFTRNFGIEYLLAGDTPRFPGGDMAIVDWDANIEHFPPGLDETKQTFLVTNCYLYTTHAAPVVCIDPSPFSEGEKACRPNTYNPQNGQGAPVAVTNIKQENTPRQSIFTISVENKGGGTVWNPGKIEKCSPYQGTRVTSNDKNKVWLGQVRVSGDPTWLDCTPDDFVRLDQDTDTGMVTCRYDIPFQGLQSAYQTPLVVELWYGYEETIRKTVTIKRAI